MTLTLEVGRRTWRFTIERVPRENESWFEYHYGPSVRGRYFSVFLGDTYLSWSMWLKRTK